MNEEPCQILVCTGVNTLYFKPHLEPADGVLEKLAEASSG